jgi:hypothetical protein
MPFTFAHPAAALPFRKTRLLTSAVVIGAMSPDFEYFFRLGPQGRFGHTLLGLVTLTLPLALSVFWLFHRAAKFAMVRLLPNSVQRRLAPRWADFDFGNARRFALLLLSLLAGALTHLLWDSFTHEQSWLVEHWPLLRETVAVPWPHSHPILICMVLHLLSTLAGLGILAVWFTQWFHSTSPEQAIAAPLSHHLKLRVVRLLSIFALCGALLRNELFHSRSSFSHFEAFAVTLIALLWWQLVALGWWWRPKQTAPSTRREDAAIPASHAGRHRRSPAAALQGR